MPKSSSGRAARYEELDKTLARRYLNCGGRSLTMIIPRDEGPNASVRVSEVTEPEAC